MALGNRAADGEVLAMHLTAVPLPVHQPKDATAPDLAQLLAEQR